MILDAYKRILQLWWNKSHVACVESLLRLIFDLVQDVVSLTIYKDPKKVLKQVNGEFLSFILFLFCSTFSCLECAFLDKISPFLGYGT